VTASIFVVRKLINDKIISVLSELIDFFDMLMRKFKPASNVSAASDIYYILNNMSDYLGHVD
jgi:hypothetical protein